MSGQNDRKLYRLERALPEGLLVDAAWLEERGYYPQLRKRYVELGWLVQPARGVYRRPRGALSWQQAIVSLQTLLQVPVVVGGRTALEAEGYAHYLAHGEKEVHLYGPRVLPSWTEKLPLKERLVFHKSTRLFRGDPPERGLASLNADEQDAFTELQPDVIVQHWGQWDWPLLMSTPERALLELLDELPSRESFHQVDALIEGLPNLSPRRLQHLLAACRNVKVKRLFFFFADRHGHSWRKYIDPQTVDLGSGKRMLVSGGKLDPTYQITVPEDLNGVQ